MAETLWRPSVKAKAETLWKMTAKVEAETLWRRAQSGETHVGVGRTGHRDTLGLVGWGADGECLGLGNHWQASTGQPM